VVLIHHILHQLLVLFRSRITTTLPIGTSTTHETCPRPTTARMETVPNFKGQKDHPHPLSVLQDTGGNFSPFLDMMSNSTTIQVPTPSRPPTRSGIHHFHPAPLALLYRGFAQWLQNPMERITNSHRPHSTITPPTNPHPSAQRTRTNWMAPSCERIHYFIMGKCSCNTPNPTMSCPTRTQTTYNLSHHQSTT
jgi:hypothetical protein